MSHRRLFVLLIAVGALAGSLAGLGSVRGDERADERAAARAALKTAIERGQALYAKRWVDGGKPCAECHGPGPNQLRSSRLKAYPKWDKASGKVISGQQKLSQMVKEMCKGEAPALGSDDLNALEAYVSTLR